MNVKSSVVIRPVRWTSSRNLDEIPAISEADYDLLSELQVVLARHDALDRFGITLLHKHFDLKPGEILVEYTSAINRILTTKVEEFTDPNRGRAIETSWKLCSEKPTISCDKICVYKEGKHQIQDEEGL